jgi:hypothetical protein
MMRFHGRQNSLRGLLSLWALLFLSSVGSNGCGILGPRCSDVIVREYPSPDGDFVASVFERNCGATTDYSTHVALRRSGEAFSGEPQHRITTVSGRSVIELSWIGPQTLRVSTRQDTIFLAEDAWDRIDILYE